MTALSIAALFPYIFWNYYTSYTINILQFYNNNLNIYDSNTLSTSVRNYNNSNNNTCDMNINLSFNLKTFQSLTAYNYLQAKYWNIGFLSQFHWKQIPNFCLALPVIMLSISAIYSYINNLYLVWCSKNDIAGSSTKSTSIAIATTINDNNNNDSSIDFYDCNNRLSYNVSIFNNSNNNKNVSSSNNNISSDNNTNINSNNSNGNKSYSDNNNNNHNKNHIAAQCAAITHLTVCLLICILYAHIQITTRVLFSSCPILYIYSASIFNNQYSNKTKTEEICKTETKVYTSIHIRNNEYQISKYLKLNWKLYLLSYYIIYFAMGIILHTNFYPWT